MNTIHSNLLTALSLFWGALAVGIQAAQQDIPAPPNSGSSYADTVVVLPNGNIVVTDHTYSPPGAANAGAVYLLDGADLTVISTLTGTVANDRVGLEGVTVLSNGNFVVASPAWNANRGAATWGHTVTGFIGGPTVAVSDTNSLVGSATNNRVSDESVTVLTNGNYVIRSPMWDGANPDVGAATWGDGSSGTVGVVSAANSLVGTSFDDQISADGVIPLTNGNYVVRSLGWRNTVTDAGAATWGNGNGGTVGEVSAANSLVGTTAFDTVGSKGIFALTNGHYVVSSPRWAGAVSSLGAATWGNGNGGTVGTISAANSLVGSTSGDGVGSSGITVLTDGNYVVRSPGWNGITSDTGAATWGNGTIGTTGTVSEFNSLVGASVGDQVSSSGVTALGNGSYVVCSLAWNGVVASGGAATWCGSGGGTVGFVSTGNSLYGTTVNDRVGSLGAVALANGNYVVVSPLWDGVASNVGAVTWGNGSAVTAGAVSASNSLVGSTANDNVGSQLGGAVGVAALTNGHYVVVSSEWDGAAANVGAATWADGNGGTVGPVSAANSLVGTKVTDNIGRVGVTALSNGNYVVGSSAWDGAVANVGAATWGNGSGGTVGPVSTANSLVGSNSGDSVTSSGITALPNGDFLVYSHSWRNPVGPAFSAGAHSYGNGSTGGTVGAVSAANSLLGTVTNGVSLYAAFDPVRNRVLVGRGPSKLLSILTLTPEISAPTSTSITGTGATLGGEITNDSGSGITERGIVFAPTASDSDPNVGDPGVTKVVEGGTTTGVFTHAVGGLTAGTSYSFKAYAINAKGTSHSSVATFSTPAPSAPEIAVEQPALTDLVDGVASVDFGTVAVGGSGAATTFTVRNTGTSDLTLGTITSNAADFTVSTSGTLPIITAGSSTTFTVTFTPTTEGSRSGTLQIPNDDADEAPFDISLIGTAISPAQAFANAMSAASLGGADAAADATPMKDGVANLLKYAFNMTLTAPDVEVLTPGTGTAGLPSVTQPTPGILRVEYLRKVDSGIVYVPMKSSTLASGSWVPLLGPPTVTAIDATWERVVHDEPFVPATTPRLFGQLEITLP